MRFLDACDRERGIDPASESVFGIELTLAVSHHNELLHLLLTVTYRSLRYRVAARYTITTDSWPAPC